MKYLAKPSKTASGELQVPGDKSISHRAIMLAAIAEGSSRITGFLDGEDCIATLHAFEQMGVKVERPALHELIITGVGKTGLQNPASGSLDHNRAIPRWSASF